METRPLLSPFCEDSSLDPLSCGPDGVHFPTLDGPFDHDVESGARKSLDVETESRENQRSSCFNILASGMLFSSITKATGLWNPRKSPYTILCAFFVALNFLSLVAEIIIPSVCEPFVDRCVTQESRATNVTSNNDNASESNAAKIYEITLAFDVWNALSDTMTYILLIHTLCRVQQQMPLLSLASAKAKVSRREWLFINVMFIICSTTITIASALRISIVESSKMRFYGTFGSGVLIVYLTAFICTCVFVVLTCAMSSLVDVCFNEICSMSHATLNKIIALHQKLCGQLSTASQILAPWFLVHWLMFGANCIAVFAFDSMHFEFLTHKFSGAPTVFMAVAFVLNFALFLVPCVFASRVTWKCEALLFKLNNMTARDWNEEHPFCERTNVNAFLFYAERSKCGFLVRNITFGSSGTWISALLGLLGLGIRFVQYIN